MFGAIVMSGGYLQFQAPQLRNLPIKRINFKSQQNERLNFINEVQEKYLNITNQEDIIDIIKYIEKYLPNISSEDKVKNDIVHDYLAFLAQEMIILNKKKQKEKKSLFEILENSAKVDGGLDKPSNKAIIKNFLGDYQKNEYHLPFEDIVKVLQKNKSKLGVNLNQPGLLKELEREYEKSLEKLLPIKQRLALTDKLIDQIVYRLYGLTEEEIKIVEGG